MNFKDLEVGNDYIDTNGDHVTVKYIGEGVIVSHNHNEGVEWTSGSSKNWKVKPKSREKITLYECICKDGTIRLLDDNYRSQEYHQRQAQAQANGNHYLGETLMAQKLPNGRTIEIYADSFEVCRE